VKNCWKKAFATVGSDFAKLSTISYKTEIDRFSFDVQGNETGDALIKPASAISRRVCFIPQIIESNINLNCAGGRERRAASG
jgi:hypothetical protein